MYINYTLRVIRNIDVKGYRVRYKKYGCYEYNLKWPISNKNYDIPTYLKKTNSSLN